MSRFRDPTDRRPNHVRRAETLGVDSDLLRPRPDGPTVPDFATLEGVIRTRLLELPRDHEAAAEGRRLCRLLENVEPAANRWLERVGWPEDPDAMGDE